jgi:TonB family protein
MPDVSRPTDHTPPARATLAPPLPPANERFKAGWDRGLWLSISAATVVHFLVLAAWPDMSVAVEVPERRGPVELLDPTLKVEAPEPPAPLARPAAPTAGEIALAPDVRLDAPLPDLPDFDAVAPPPPAGAPRATPGARFVPHTVAPELENERDVRRILEREYPALLRRSGIGGVVVVWAFVGLDGAVEEVEIRESSGYDGMDAAALRVAGRMRFRPAMNRDRTVAVWVSIPITFRVGNTPPTAGMG